MPDKKKNYDVAKRFSEVARRAKETPIYGLKTDRSVKTHHKLEDEHSASDLTAFATRPGRMWGKPKDVNLPIETASPEVLERLRKRRK